MTTYLIIAAVSYLLGSIPFGYILVRIFLKQDIRATGSGNIGATNVARSAPVLGIVTLFLDALKGSVAVFGVGLLHVGDVLHYGNKLPSFYAEVAVACVFVVAGHMFPVWLRFHGGKGVATGVGAFALIAPKAMLLALLVFLVVVAIFRYVSLASVAATFTFPFFVVWEYRGDLGEVWPEIVGVVVVCALIILKHHANIRRLLAGTENRLGAKPNLPPSGPTEKPA